MRYTIKTYEPDPTQWPSYKDRCCNGQGAGSVSGCILPRGHRDRGQPHHIYDDAKFETIAEVSEITTYSAECYRCNVELHGGPFYNWRDAETRLDEHMRNVHPELVREMNL